jgi:manganese transport protein
MTTSELAVAAERRSLFAPVARVLTQIVGPAAMMAAGMVGAGAVSTRLLSGAWFGFDLLWCALYVIPMVVVTLDSASRVGVLSGGRGMMQMIRSELSPTLAWLIFLTQVPINIVVNMSQFSVMADALEGLGLVALPGAGMSLSRLALCVAVVGVVIALGITGGFKRMQSTMTVLLLVTLLCFITVAVRGLFAPGTLRGVVSGLVPSIPEDLPVRGTTEVRSAFTQLMAIAGQSLPAAVFLSYGYFTSNAGVTAEQLDQDFKKTALNLGVLWGLFSVVVVVCGVTALHDVYVGEPLHYSQIASVKQAGAVLTPALPAALAALATPVFSLGLLAATFTTTVGVGFKMSYFTLDLLGLDWRMRAGNRAFYIAFAFYVALPGVLAPFWTLPSLVQAILAMAGNLLVAPLAVLIIFHFINRSRLGSSLARNVILGLTFAFSLFVVAWGAWRQWT